MYFVLEEGSEITIAICHFEDVAYEIAKNFPRPCIVRYTYMSNSVYAKGAKFFKENKEEKEKIA
jgi:hypothetical protein